MKASISGSVRVDAPGPGQHPHGGDGEVILVHKHGKERLAKVSQGGQGAFKCDLAPGEKLEFHAPHNIKATFSGSGTLDNTGNDHPAEARLWTKKEDKTVAQAPVGGTTSITFSTTESGDYLHVTAV